MLRFRKCLTTYGKHTVINLLGNVTVTIAGWYRGGMKSLHTTAMPTYYTYGN